MNRIILSSILALTLLVAFVPVTNAEMAKEGTGQYKGVFSYTTKAIPMGKERLQVTYEAVGLVVDAPAESPFYNSTFYVIGALHAIKGVYKDHNGFIRYTCPNGDNIFATYLGSGEIGVSKKVTYTFVGGTGQCAGIEGGAELSGGKGFPRPTKDVKIGMSVGKVHWKIPQKKK
jgi:hypothetical protein